MTEFDGGSALSGGEFGAVPVPVHCSKCLLFAPAPVLKARFRSFPATAHGIFTDPQLAKN